MKIAIATKNNGKLKEFEELAKGTSYEFIKIPENITLMVVDSQTGKKVSFGSKKTLIESYKTEKINQNFDVNLKNNNRFNNNNILKFY